MKNIKRIAKIVFGINDYNVSDDIINKIVIEFEIQLDSLFNTLSFQDDTSLLKTYKKNRFKDLKNFTLLEVLILTTYFQIKQDQDFYRQNLSTFPEGFNLNSFDYELLVPVLEKFNSKQ